MDKISFEKIGEDLIVKLHTSDSFKKFRKIPNVREDIIINHTKENRQYTLPFENFFSKYQKAHSLKRELTNDEKFVIEYEHRHDSLKFFYSGTRDTSELIHDLGHVSYGIGKETIIEVRIKNLTDFLEKENEVITEKCLINDEEKEIISFYLDVLRRYEKSFSGENKDKVSNARTYLDLIYSEFPLINESYINVIGEVLEGIEFSELEVCAESIKDMQRKIIRLTCLEKEPLKDKTNEYIEEYIEEYRSNRANLTNVFDDEEIDKIPEIKEQKIVEVRHRIPRIRRILEIRYKYARPRQQETIKSYITEIKNFETKAYFIHEDEERLELKSLLDVFGGISELSGLNFVIGPVIKILKAIFALDKLRGDYIREKEEYSNYDSQDPIDALHRRYLNVDIRTEQARNRYIVELAELIIRKHGRMTVIELGNCFDRYYSFDRYYRNDREFRLSRIRKDQIQNAVYSSNRFRVVDRRPLIGMGKRKYNVYDVRRRWH